MPGLMKEPFSLESIYTDVKLLDDRSIRAFAAPEHIFVRTKWPESWR